MTTSYTWYAYPQNSYTNKVIAQLIGQETSTEESSKVMCADGEERDLWRIARANLQRLWDSRNDLKLTFQVFKQTGHGKIFRAPDFLFEKTKQPPKPQIPEKPTT